jgi:hypothetical protein
MITYSETQLYQELLKLLKSLQFEQVEIILNEHVKPANIIRTLHQVTELGAGIMTYTFVNYILTKTETPFWHRVAACVISESIEHIQEGNNAGLYHILKAIQLAPEDWLLKEYALSFYEDGILEEEMAVIFAKEVLLKEPFNKLALKITDKSI